MNKEHVISDQMLSHVQVELSQNQHWIAYNRIPYFLEKGDVYFFKHEEEAREFADNNISDYDDYKVIHATSITDVFRQIPYGEQLTTILSSKNEMIMNEKNFEYLKDNIKYLGFGDKMFADLESNIKKGKNEFTLSVSTMFNKDPIGATLHFKRSDTSDMYFLNKYDATLEKPGKEAVTRTIYLDKGKGITMKEAYNLLDGRSVFKELTSKEEEKYHAWLQLDFKERDQHNNFKLKQFHENYGYNIIVAVQNLIVADRTGDKEEQLIKSLQKGNVQSVTLRDRNDKEVKVFIEANPQYKTLNIYDAGMKPLSQEQKQGFMIETDLQPRQRLSQHESKEQGQSNTDAENDRQQKEEIKMHNSKAEKQEDKKETKQKNSLLPKKQKSNGLLEKKRTSNKNGLHL